MFNRFIKLLISLVYFFCYKIYSFINWKLPGTFTILLYHELTPRQRQRFIKQLESIKCSTNPVSSDFSSRPAWGKHNVAVTFDDSFSSVFDIAIPDLYRQKIPFTIFVPTAFLGKRQAWIKNKAHNCFNEYVATEKQLRELDDNFVTIGSHTHTHPQLTFLNENELKNELEESKTILERITGKEVNLLAFPYGEYNNKIIDLSKTAGYTRAFTVLPNHPFAANTRFLAGRLDASADDWRLEFWLKIRGAYQWLGLASAFKKGLLSLCS